MIVVTMMMIFKKKIKTYVKKYKYMINNNILIGIVFLAGNRLSSVKYTTYRKKSLGNEN